MRGGQSGYYDPSPADAYTKLVADEDKNNNCNGSNCIPLILIHGIHGNEINGVDDISNPNRDYWVNLLNFSYKNGLNSKYKIYRFHYVSDMYSVWEIARSLRNKLDFAIDAKQINDIPFVMIAHSMGGLVARSYMEEHSHKTGFYGGANHSDGKRGGERIVKLITLATPHHGSPGANHDSRNQLASNADTRDWIYQSVWGLGNDWSTLISGASLSVWSMINHISYDQYNRKDLLWDNFDGVMNNANNDINLWLKDYLNSNSTYDTKLIAYYGYLDPTNSTYQDIVNLIFTIYGGPTKILLPYATSSDDHDKLLAGSIALNYGLFKQDVSPDGKMGPYAKNDGMVPLQSAAFNGHTVSKQVECPGYDHLYMKDNNVTQCNTGKTLFESLKDDLSPIYPDADNDGYTSDVDCNDN
ncbi:MAG: hypothetical protein AABY26_05530, partial [Nanoarchaeota archaeon]